MSSDKQEQDSSVRDLPVVSSDEEVLRVNRRRLISTGLGASAIIATVASRPAWALEKCTKSGLQSANLSGQHTFTGCGKSAGFWKKKLYSWPEGVKSGDSFTATFGSVTYKGQVLFSGKNLGQVIGNTKSSNSNPSNIGLHLVGAYVNSFAFPKDSPSGKGFVYTPAQIKSMFYSAAQSNSFNTLKTTLESANNLYDPITEWSH